MDWHKKIIKSTTVVCLLLGLFPALFFALPARLKGVRGFIDKLEWASYDLRMRIRPQRQLDPRLVLVGITDVDYYLYGERIFNREVYAFALQCLRSLKVNSVLLDVLFEQSRDYDSLVALRMQELPTYIAYKFLTKLFPKRELEQEYGLDEATLQEELRQLTTEEEFRQRTQSLLERIEELKEEKALLHKQAKLDEVKLKDRLITKTEILLSLIGKEYLRQKYRIDYSWLDKKGVEQLEPYKAQETILPIGLFLINARGFGFINVEKGTEEVLRRVPLVYSDKDQLYPNLDLVFLCDYYGVEPKELKIYPGKYVEFKPTRNYSGTKRIPIDEKGNFLINFHEGESFLRRGFALHQLFHYIIYEGKGETRLRPSQFKDAIVILGENNVGGTDTQPIPLQPGFPLVGVRANVLDNILNDDYVRLLKPPLPTLIILFFGLLMGITFILMEYRKATIIATAFILFLILSAILLFNKYSLVIPIVTPLATISFSYLFLILYKVGIAEKERRQVRRVFFKTVSPEIGEEILRQYDNPAIWGGKQLVTVMFADIRGFTTWSEGLKPERTVELLNAFYDIVSTVIFDHGGQINKFMGDEVMALFSAPIPRQDAEAQAVLTAVEIQRRVKQLNSERIEVEFGKPMHLGIGINTGEAVVGTVGGKQTRIEYTALGDDVNIAARLQKIAQPEQILIGEKTLQLACKNCPQLLAEKNITFFPHPEVLLKGKQARVNVYEVLYDARQPASIRATETSV